MATVALASSGISHTLTRGELTGLIVRITLQLEAFPF